MVETGPWEARLGRANIVVPSVVRAFLQEFGGLRIEFADVTSRHANAYMRISPAAAREAIDARWGMDVRKSVDQLNAWAGCSLCPVGAAEANRFVLLMAADGHVFSATPSDMWLVAETGTGAIAALCLGQRRERVHGADDVPKSERASTWRQVLVTRRLFACCSMQGRAYTPMCDRRARRICTMLRHVVTYRKHSGGSTQGHPSMQRTATIAPR
jgi:hypothetical protein